MWYVFWICFIALADSNNLVRLYALNHTGTVQHWHGQQALLPCTANHWAALEDVVVHGCVGGRSHNHPHVHWRYAPNTVYVYIWSIHQCTCGCLMQPQSMTAASSNAFQWAAVQPCAQGRRKIHYGFYLHMKFVVMQDNLLADPVRNPLGINHNFLMLYQHAHSRNTRAGYKFYAGSAGNRSWCSKVTVTITKRSINIRSVFKNKSDLQRSLHRF